MSEAGSSKPAGRAPSVPSCLTRLFVFRKVPADVRCRLDEVILLRPSDCPTLEAIEKKFDLQKRYGVSPAALRVYARRLEQLVRPAVASQVSAAVLGALPPDFQQSVVTGSRVLLLSRIVRSLTDDQVETIPVADLARFASMLAAMRRQTHGSQRAGTKKTSKHDAVGERTQPDETPDPSDPKKLMQTIRALYGLARPAKKNHPNDKAETADVR